MKIFLLVYFCFVCIPAFGIKITYSCAGNGQEFHFCKVAAETWSKKTGNAVEVISAPNSTTERLALYQQQFAAASPDIDVLQVDVIWPAMLAHYLEDLSPYVQKDILQKHFSTTIQNNTVDGKLLALPLYIDAGLLFYRKDLLQAYKQNVPQTWEALEAVSKVIQAGERKKGNTRFWGFVFQGRAYEGLTCNALEWVYSSGGGSIVNERGEVDISNPQAVSAIARASGWVDTISPKGVLNYGEEESRGVFQSGNAAFMRNWPYAWKLANEKGSAIFNKVGISVLPMSARDGQHAATLGGWGASVSRYSKHKKVAADFVNFLASESQQKLRAIEGSYNPSIESLYKDKEVLKAAPFIGELYETFAHAVARPSRMTGVQYNRVSSEFWEAVHRALSKKEDAKTALANLDRRLNRISKTGKWHAE